MLLSLRFTGLARWLISTVLLLALVPGSAQQAQAQVFEWAKAASGSSAWNASNATHADNAGNSYYTGIFKDQLTIGSVTVSSAGGNVYAAKLNPAGAVDWIKHFPTDTSQQTHSFISDIEVDATGNVIIAGNVNGEIHFGNTVFSDTSVYHTNFFVAKLSSAGNLLWAKQGQGSLGDIVSNVSLDGAGNVYLSGYTNSPVLTYDNQALAGNGVSFLIKTNASGQLLWNNWLEAYALNIAVDANGNGVATGLFYDTLLVLGNGISVPSFSGNLVFSGFVAAFNSSGQYQWGQPYGGLAIEPRSVHIGPAGDVYVMGTFWNTFVFNGTTVAGATPLVFIQAYNDVFLVKLNATGALQWVKTVDGLGQGFPQMFPGTVPMMAIDNAGHIVLAGSHGSTIRLADSVYHYPLSQYHDVAVAKLDSDGNVLWVQGVSGPGYEFLEGLGTDGLGNIFVQGSTGASGGSGSTTLFGQNLTLAISGQSTFMAKLQGNANRITGRIFVDHNSSGTQDAGEPGLPQIMLALQPGQQNMISGYNGNYVAYTAAGSYQVGLPQAPNYYTASPASHPAAFSGLGQTDSLNHFALQPIGAVHDLQVSVVGLFGARPGFTYRNRITYRNAGTTVMSGTIRFVSDTLLVFQAATPGIGSVSGDTLSWSFSALQPFESRQITVDWLVPATAALGTQLTVHAYAGPVATDQTPADNYAQDTVTVTGSYDPNDKLVSHAQLTPGQVSSRQPLTYTVRFQNTGTDTAFAVMVRDQLSALLDMSTLEVISASHPFTAELTGPATLQWRFSNIMLPDSNTNEPASHGYIQYRIKPLATLAVGQHINTSADIYFDFNAPVATNITDTEVVLANSTAGPVASSALQVYPNPSTGLLTVRLPVSGTGQVRLRVINALGVEVHSSLRPALNNSFHQQLNLAAQPSGIYFIQATANGRSYTRKLVLE